MTRLIDLSHPLEHGQLNFPFDPKIAVLAHNSVASIGYNMTQISMATHQGTHLDVPFHFYDNGLTVDQMPLERFYGPAVLVDLAPGGDLPARTPITVEMLAPHAAKFQPGAKVIYRTGWDRTFGTAECFSDFPDAHPRCRPLDCQAADRSAGHGYPHAQRRVEGSAPHVAGQGRGDRHC